ncbi:DUR4 [Candida margitis]|uniref:DUR4 n=1 Tax=Candida margitis TaxID=1775924 RepID=UPI0022263D58|nr:DUR4 [Candida margitis]KAI5953841.1 DUR4 [Candida margitis]
MFVFLPFILTLGATAPIVTNTVIVTQTNGVDQNLPTAQALSVQITASLVQNAQVDSIQTASTSGSNFLQEIAQLFGFGSASSTSSAVATTAPAANTASPVAPTTTTSLAAPTTTASAIGSLSPSPSSVSAQSTSGVPISSETSPTQSYSASSALESSQSSDFDLDEAVPSTPQSGNAYLITVNKLWQRFWGNGKWNQEDSICQDNSFETPSVWDMAVLGKAIADSGDSNGLETTISRILEYYDSTTGAFSSTPNSPSDIYSDDNAQLSWVFIAAYKMTNNQQYLKYAEGIVDFLKTQNYQNTGGIIWQKDKSYIASISTTEAALSAMRLYEVNGDDSLVEFAQSCMNFMSKYLQDSDSLFYDGLDSSSWSINKGKLTYTVGCAISALVKIGTQDALEKALDLATAATNQDGAFYTSQKVWNNSLKYVHLLFVGFGDAFGTGKFDKFKDEVTKQGNYIYEFLQDPDDSNLYFDSATSGTPDTYAKYAKVFSTSGSTYKPNEGLYCSGSSSGPAPKDLLINASAVMNYVTFLQNKFSIYNSKKVDEFVSGSRSVGFGLLLSGILSNWTWSLTLLESAVKSYDIGISGSYWYAIGGLMQVSVFSVVSSKIKKNANLVTTFPEMGYFRFGKAGHLSFLWCGFVCNAIVSSCILLGGSAVFNAVTGISQYAALFLIPFGCAIYVSFGGLRATFISDATHTCIILVFIIVFMFEVYFGSDKIGSPKKMWELLESLPPVDDNYHGSYLTFRSKQGAIFSIVSIVTGFGLVVNDQAYLSRAVAADPKITSRAYFFASVCWFVIPFAMGAGLGLAGRALSVYDDSPTLSEFEVGEGLAPVAAATYLMGKSGSAMILVMIFFSVTSSFAGELIGTSTLISYDIFKRYIKPDATPKQVVRAAKISVFGWAIFSSCLASIFYGAAKISAVGGAVGGMFLGIIAWLVTCKTYTGEVNVTNLSDQWVSFTGNVTALFMGGFISIVSSLIWPAKFDFEQTRNRTSLINRQSHDAAQGSTNENEYENEKARGLKQSSVEITQSSTELSNSEAPTEELDMNLETVIDHKHLDHQFKKYGILVAILALVMAIVIPVPLSASAYILSPNFLLGTVIIIIIWLFCSFFYVVVLPLVEARHSIWNILKLLVSRGKALEKMY